MLILIIFTLMYFYIFKKCYKYLLKLSTCSWKRFKFYLPKKSN